MDLVNGVTYLQLSPRRASMGAAWSQRACARPPPFVGHRDHHDHNLALHSAGCAFQIIVVLSKSSLCGLCFPNHLVMTDGVLTKKARHGSQVYIMGWPILMMMMMKEERNAFRGRNKTWVPRVMKSTSIRLRQHHSNFIYKYRYRAT